MKGMVLRTARSLATLPSAAGWRECGLVGVVAILLIGIVAVASGLLHYRLRLDPLLLTILIVPALTEELVFRGPLPGKNETVHPIYWLTGGVLVFVLWHILEALTFLPGATLFFTPGFLISAAILGTACAVMRYRTGSLWPAVALHGVVVLLWQVLFGGPSAAELMQG
jgi:predicted Abi (CAAX) family protease